MPGSTLKVPVTHTDEVEHRRRLADGVNGALDGKISSIVDVSLSVSPATSTTLQDFRVHPGSAILLMPLDANGAADIVGMYAVPGDRTFDIIHPANAASRTIRCVILG